MNDDIKLVTPELDGVDRAVELLVADAEAHEKANSNEDGFCEGHRVSLVVFLMLRLGLDLYSLGLVAAGLAEMTAVLDSEESDDDSILQSDEIVDMGDHTHTAGDPCSVCGDNG
jgi:hypothetical protein